LQRLKGQDLIWYGSRQWGFDLGLIGFEPDQAWRSRLDDHVLAVGLARRKRTELLEALRQCFARTETWQQAGKYVSALVSELPRRNGWTIAQHAGDRAQDRTQRALNRAAWDTCSPSDLRLPQIPAVPRSGLPQAYSPTAPSMRSRSRSRWPQWRAVSSIMCASA
jgi:hypothetical protein